MKLAIAYKYLLISTTVAMLTLISASGLAKHIYRYRDQNGILHFTDQKPIAEKVTELKATLVQPERQNIVTLSMQKESTGQTLVFQNHWSGPVAIEVMFDKAENAGSDPMLPLLTVLKAQEHRSVARIFPRNAGSTARFSVVYTAVPGDFSAQHDDHQRYAIPFTANSKYYLAQGPGGPFSHTDVQSRDAYDLAAAEGTPVLAARQGIVMQVERDFFGSGLDHERYSDRANSVRILHDDGSMGVYAHLQLESVIVSPGQRVNVGQKLALSGNTGFSTGPHLHFVVQVNRDMELVSVPIQFAEPLQQNAH